VPLVCYFRGEFTNNPFRERAGLTDFRTNSFQQQNRIHGDFEEFVHPQFESNAGRVLLLDGVSSIFLAKKCNAKAKTDQLHSSSLFPDLQRDSLLVWPLDLLTTTL